MLNLFAIGTEKIAMKGIFKIDKI